MSTISFFFVFIPFIAILLLIINLLFASHNPYLEKDSPFECGYHSFLGQNRTQFNITFYIFGLCFLVFDLEILLLYPYAVSAYTNNIYGLIIALTFVLLLTIGLVYELGKGVLQIKSRQYVSYYCYDLNNIYGFTNKTQLSNSEKTYREYCMPNRQSLKKEEIKEKKKEKFIKALINIILLVLRRLTPVYFSVLAVSIVIGILIRFTFFFFLKYNIWLYIIIGTIIILIRQLLKGVLEAMFEDFYTKPHTSFFEKTILKLDSWYHCRKCDLRTKPYISLFDKTILKLYSWYYCYRFDLRTKAIYIRFNGIYCSRFNNRYITHIFTGNRYYFYFYIYLNKSYMMFMFYPTYEKPIIVYLIKIVIMNKIYILFLWLHKRKQNITKNIIKVI